MQHSPASPQEKRFAQLFCVFFVCLGSLVFVFKRTDLFPWTGSCNASGYSDDHYLAYCHSTRYGDYEHYALYNGSEPAAIDALKQASVVFLGNSNTQYAFSTKSISDYFRNNSKSHYVMGFGQGAQSPVASAVMLKHNLKPDLVVANIDPFFSTQTNGTFQRVLADDDAIHREFDRKKRVQRWQGQVCSNPSSKWARWVCQGQAETLFRSKSNGHWVTDYYRENQRHPVSESTDLLDTLDNAVIAANEFIEQVGVDRDCVVLTVTPRTGTPAAFAQRLANALLLPLITPTLENLVTIDHSHLDKQSAERWSAAFIEQFDEHVQRCARSVSHASADAGL